MNEAYTRHQVLFVHLSGNMAQAQNAAQWVNKELDRLARAGATIVGPVQLMPGQFNGMNHITGKQQSFPIMQVQIDYEETVTNTEGLPTDEDETEPDSAVLVGVSGNTPQVADMLEHSLERHNA